jgi:LDH2 family malate/lactate/ureidoglycolate dehydrogenase
MRVAVTELCHLAQVALSRAGVPDKHAKIQSDLFIEAEMRGFPSHGLLRLPRVIERIRAGLSVPEAIGTHSWSSHNFLQVDGERGLGPVVALEALDAIIPRAIEDGIAIASIRNANHLGALAYYVEYAAKRDITCIGLTLSEALVHPYGGRQALIGTNPIAIGVPAEPEPLVLDMATSRVSMGKIHDYANRGLDIPADWALDEKGDPTTNPQAAKSGALAPFGGPKGYALGVTLEVLVASLAASAIGRQIQGTLDSTNPSNKGDVFIAISAPDLPYARAMVSEYLNELRETLPAEPGQPVLVPGDRARICRERSLQNGIEFDDKLFADLKMLAAA